MATGLPEKEAARRARIEFGAAESYKENCREEHGLRWPAEVVQDLRYGLRALSHSPGFAAISIISLALGVGANSVVFSAINSLLLRPFPVPEAERIYSINRNHDPSNSFPNYREIRDHNQVFDGLFAYRMAPMSLENAGAAQRVWGYLVTGNYFGTLKLRPAVGRFFGPSEDVHENASPYAVISYDSWRTRFGGDPGIAGKTVRINSVVYTVLGVAPQGFHGTEAFYWPEIWLPMMMQPSIEGHSWLKVKQDYNAWIAGRLKPGVTSQQADADLSLIAANLVRAYTGNEGIKLTVARAGFGGATGRDPLQAFAGGVMLLAALVLLAACANLASMVSARVADRQREFAVRLSIGAGRGRLLRQLLTESLLLSLLGGCAGFALAAGVLHLINQWRAPLDFPVSFQIPADFRVFAFTFAVALFTGLIFGIIPARAAWKTDPNQGLKAGMGSAVVRRWALRDILLAAQVALCCLLVTSSFVALRSMAHSLRMPLGFQAQSVAILGYDLGLAGYDENKGRQFDNQLKQSVSAIPGLDSVAYASSVPLSIDQSTTTVFSEDTTDFRNKNSVSAGYYCVSPDYFRTMQTRFLAGRDFTAQDKQGMPEVIVINETGARKLLGDANWIGRHVRWNAKRPPMEVIGVVEDGKYETLTEEPKSVIFQSILQKYNGGTRVLLARSSRPESEVAAEMRRARATLDPHLPAYGVGSLSQMLGFAYLPARAALLSLGAFGLLAIMLAVTGIYGVSAYTVSRRTREIGIRVAIGARPAAVLRTMFLRTGTLVGIGCMAGLLLGAAGAQVLSAVVYHATSRDPLVIAGVVLTMGIIGLAAVLGPARKVLRVDPVNALRQD
jgi:predicted permease